MLRVLHVLHGMGRGGVETWLMHVLRRSDRTRIRLDFAVATADSQAYDNEVAARGSTILRCPPLSSPLTYARALAQHLRRHGPYDVVHSHLAFYSGIVLAVAARAGVAGRIAHIHTAVATRSLETFLSRSLRATYRRLLRPLLFHYMTAGIANSDASGRYLFAKSWGRDPRLHRVLYGFDFDPYLLLPPRGRLRHELGLPPRGKMLVHVGRLHPTKNHVFLLQVFSELIRQNFDCHLVLVGDGPLRSQLENLARELSLGGRCHFVGDQDAVHRFLGAADLMVFPSLFEGLGIAVVEAQAAGLSVIASDSLPPESDVIPDLVRRLPLALGPNEWARTIALQFDSRPSISQPDAAQAVRQSAFGIDRCIRELELLYEPPPITRAPY